jgi:hypothetical protein
MSASGKCEPTQNEEPKPKLRPILFAIKWGNPYTNPPEGMPRELIAVTRIQESTGDIPPEIIGALETVARPGSGWALCIGIDEDARPKRRFSLQAKGSIRRKSLERRVRKKAPLFADRIIADELAANPSYFNPIEE